MNPPRPDTSAPPLRASSFTPRAMIVLSRWRIEVGFVLGSIVLVTANPTRTSIAAGLPVLLAGLGLRGWGRGHLTRRAHLTQSGPYAFVRHPLYVGSFLLGLSFAIMTGIVWLSLLFPLIFTAMYLPKALREEAFLRERYGDEYAAYADRVGRFFPHLRRVPPAFRGAQQFSWERVFGHREQLTWLGALAALGLMWAVASGWIHQLAHYAAAHWPWVA